MNERNERWLETIRLWIVPVMSLFIALSALWYNAWRNEMSEHNRNMRAAGFEIIKELVALQLIANYAHYEHNNMQGNPISGWAHILLIEDLSMFMPEHVKQETEKLHSQWEAHVSQLAESEADNQAIEAAIASTREQVVEALKKLH